MTYQGIDINRIRIGGDCRIGTLQSEYDYDANHRLLGQRTKLLQNDQTDPGLFNTRYRYDPAGNIQGIKRNGIDPTAGDPLNGYFQFGLIDAMEYTYIPSPYGSGKVLSTIKDAAPPVYQPLGYTPKETKYAYDANGNVLIDDGKGITSPITYNLLNLPGTIKFDEGVIKNTFTFGGEKLHTAGEQGKRAYLGGYEFVNGKIENYQSRWLGKGPQAKAGRLVFDDGSPYAARFQYLIKDHPASFGVGALNVS